MKFHPSLYFPLSLPFPNCKLPTPEVAVALVCFLFFPAPFCGWDPALEECSPFVILETELLSPPFSPYSVGFFPVAFSSPPVTGGTFAPGDALPSTPTLFPVLEVFAAIGQELLQASMDFPGAILIFFFAGDGSPVALSLVPLLSAAGSSLSPVRRGTLRRLASTPPRPPDLIAELANYQGFLLGLAQGSYLALEKPTPGKVNPEEFCRRGSCDALFKLAYRLAAVPGQPSDEGQMAFFTGLFEGRWQAEIFHRSPSSAADPAANPEATVILLCLAKAQGRGTSPALSPAEIAALPFEGPLLQSLAREVREEFSLCHGEETPATTPVVVDFLRQGLHLFASTEPTFLVLSLSTRQHFLYGNVRGYGGFSQVFSTAYARLRSLRGGNAGLPEEGEELLNLPLPRETPALEAAFGPHLRRDYTVALGLAMVLAERLDFLEREKETYFPNFRGSNSPGFRSPRALPFAGAPALVEGAGELFPSPLCLLFFLTFPALFLLLPAPGRRISGASR